jgi:hypothetical protein
LAVDDSTTTSYLTKPNHEKISLEHRALTGYAEQPGANHDLSNPSNFWTYLFHVSKIDLQGFDAIAFREID